MRIEITIMCSARKLSFRIDDILEITKKSECRDAENLKIDQCASSNCERAAKPAAFSSEHSSFRPYPGGYKAERDLVGSETFLKSADSVCHKKLDDRDYMYGALNRSMVGYPTTYGYHVGANRLHLPGASSYLDTYAAAFGNVVDSPSHWAMMPSGFMGYGLGGCSTLACPPYLRPIPLSTLAKRKGGQVRFTPQQTQNLERRFGSHKYLSPEDRRLLAGQLKLSDRQVKTWFQNRRAKWRRANNITTPEGEDIESDNQSDEEMTQKNNEIFQNSPNKNPPIFVG